MMRKPMVRFSKSIKFGEIGEWKSKLQATGFYVQRKTLKTKNVTTKETQCKVCLSIEQHNSIPDNSVVLLAIQ